MSENSGSSANADKLENFKRETSHRIFVNRSLQLEKIKFFGFDMDYTLAQYQSPAFEKQAFQLILRRLVDVGYPKELLKFEYDHTVPIRGLWFDKEKGFLLKVDTFGNILSCLFGLAFVPASELRLYYDNKFVLLSNRFYVYDTLFNLPEIYCLASVIEFFKSSPDCARERSGFLFNDVLVSYRSLFTDVREATNFVHDNGSLKQITVERIGQFVTKDPELGQLLAHLRAAGARVFLLTNSGFAYSDRVMTYLLGTAWRDAFDYVLVDACKPKFFADGNLLRVVDPDTNKLKLGHHTGPLRQGTVYSGGSCSQFSQLIGCRGKDVLYVGDHIFGDIIKSKKVGWRTLLIVPELANELYVWKRDESLFERLQMLDIGMSRVNHDRRMEDSVSEAVAEEVQQLKAEIRETVGKIDASYGFMGSLFRFGGRLTSFASQLEHYADLYTQSVTNLLYYPSNYMFRAPPMLMPHESTVARGDSPAEKISEDAKLAMRAAPPTAHRKTSAPNIADIHQVAQLRESHSLTGGPKNKNSTGFRQQSPEDDSSEENSFTDLMEDGDMKGAGAAATCD